MIRCCWARKSILPPPIMGEFNPAPVTSRMMLRAVASTVLVLSWGSVKSPMSSSVMGPPEFRSRSPARNVDVEAPQPERIVGRQVRREVLVDCQVAREDAVAEHGVDLREIGIQRGIARGCRGRERQLLGGEAERPQIGCGHDILADHDQVAVPGRIGPRCHIEPSQRHRELLTGDQGQVVVARHVDAVCGPGIEVLCRPQDRAGLVAPADHDGPRIGERQRAGLGQVDFASRGARRDPEDRANLDFDRIAVHVGQRVGGELAGLADVVAGN